MRTIVIGDVHGCNKTLHALLEKVKPEAETDRLVFLGDLCREVVQEIDFTKPIPPVFKPFEEDVIESDHPLCEDRKADLCPLF